MREILAGTLVLLLAQGAAAEKRNYFLKRFEGDVSLLCLYTDTVSVTISNADTFYVGGARPIRGKGRRCTTPRVVQTDYNATSFNVLDGIPDLVDSTRFNTSIWNAKPTDLVTFTAQDNVTDRGLVVEGTPVPVEIPADKSDDAASTVVIANAKGSSFSVSFKRELAALEKYLNAYLAALAASASIQSTILLQPGEATEDEDVAVYTWDTIYYVFQVNRNGTIYGHLFSATFVDTPDDLSQPQPGRRRLLSMPLRGRHFGRRRLLWSSYYDSSGGFDRTSTKTCRTCCKFVTGKKDATCACC